MSAHTPGPWEWKEGTSEITCTWNGKRHEIASVDYRKLAWHEDSNCAGRESGANARLIVAAPELLEALKAASNYVDVLGGDSKSYRQLIAKATGEQA